MKNLTDGVIVSVPTPLLNFDKLDFEGLSNLLDNLVSAGVSGICILGHTGEEHCLDFEMRRSMISEACRIVEGKVPVFRHIFQ